LVTFKGDHRAMFRSIRTMLTTGYKILRIVRARVSDTSTRMNKYKSRTYNTLASYLIQKTALHLLQILPFVQVDSPNNAQFSMQYESRRETLRELDTRLTCTGFTSQQGDP
jgi:hypothetical protein